MCADYKFQVPMVKTMKELEMVDVKTRPLPPKNDPESKKVSDFRYRAELPHPLSLRSDKPHLWFFEGYWRVSLWNRRTPDLDLWHKANAAARTARTRQEAETHRWDELSKGYCMNKAEGCSCYGQARPKCAQWHPSPTPTEST